MSFEDLSPLPKMIHPEADIYAARCTELSKRALRVCRTHLDLPYGKDYWQRVDVFVPAQNLSGLPVFVFIHGGAWSSGCKEWMGFMAPNLIGAPAIFVSVSYRKAPDFRMASQFADIANALAWVDREIAIYGGDPTRIFIGGHSAGGHLATLVSLKRDEAKAVSGFDVSAIRGVLPVSAPFDLRMHPNVSDDSLTRVHEKVLDDPGRAGEFSPIVFAAQARVPFFLTWGENDFPRIKRQNLAMVTALRAQRTQLAELEIAGASHFDTNITAADPCSPWIEKALCMVAA
jgi:acetyl esterase/lipase